MTDLDDAPTRTRRRPRVEAYTDLDDGRQPPQDLAAEQSVLGGMLLSKDAIADVLEKLRPGDFYRPNHQQIYDAILDLFGQGEPADAVTVAAELDRRGLLRRVGGAPYLHTLIAMVPTAANAGYYAGIVAEKAVLRRLVEAGTRVVQYGYAGAEGADVAEVVDRAQAEIYDVTEDRGSEDMVALEDLLQPTMDEIDAISVRWRPNQRGADRIHRTRRGHHRSSCRPDDHRRRKTWTRKVDSGNGFHAVMLDTPPHGQCDLLAGDEQVGDRDAAAVSRIQRQTRRHALRPPLRRRLDPDGRDDGQDQ